MPVNFTRFIPGRRKADPLPPEFKPARQVITLSFSKAEYALIEKLASDNGLTKGSALKSIITSYLAGDLT